MKRGALVLLSTLMVLGGCQSDRPMQMPVKPMVADEMAMLERMIGTWEGTAEMIEPPMDESFRGGNRSQWVLGGQFLKGDSWHEMGEGERAQFIEYLTWDPKAEKFHHWYFSDWGEAGEGWSEFDDEGVLHLKTRSRNADGKSSKGKGTMRFIDNDTIEWTWSEDGHMGKMTMKGTSHRVR